MKILSLIWLFLAINLSMMLFFYGGYKTQDCPNGLEACGYNDTLINEWNYGSRNYTDVNYYNSSSGEYFQELNGTTYSSRVLFDYFLNADGGVQVRLIVMFIAFATLIGGLGFVPFVNRSDISTLSFPFVIILCAGLPTVVSVWNFINSEAGAFVCPVVGTGCFISNFLAIIVAGVLGFAWIGASWEWLTGRPLS